MKTALLTVSRIVGIAGSVFAGFASTESYLPAVGRVAGKDRAEFYTTVWATNLTADPVSLTFEFLKTRQANPSPASFTDDLAPGETKVYENVVETKLGLADALGAARVTSTGEIRGFYLNPESYGLPPEREIQWAEEPEQMRRIAAASKAGQEK